MATVVAVHGIGQQFKGAPILVREWWPALRSGLQLANADFSDESDFVCPFYGHLFRPSEALSTTTTYRAEDLDPEDRTLLELWWRAAAEAEPDMVPSPEEFAADKTLVRWPQIVQRALNALAKSTFWAGISQHLLLGDLKQVVHYLNNPEVHAKVLGAVINNITADTQVVIGHSLGSVVAYEALCCKSENVISFLSLGSPLGIRNLIFAKLTPRPNAAGMGAWPGHVRHWTNIADRGDVVALQKQLAPLFGDKVKDVLVNNGSNAHHGERYLTTREAGEAIRAGLWPTSY